MNSAKPWPVVFPATNPADPAGPPILRSFDSYIDERYPPGSSERVRHDAAVARLHRQARIVQALTGWMFTIPPRWEYASRDIIEGKEYRYYHGVGHIAACFWSDMADGLLFGRHDRPIKNWLGSTLYSALDGLAFHYLDDAYVPHIADVGSRRAGHRQAAWRARRAQTINTARGRLAELQAAGVLDSED